MNVIVVGGLGQLGRALTHALAARGHRATVWDMPEVNITLPAVADAVVDARPDALINAAAWTNVDAAESNPQATYAVNALGPRWLAEGCERGKCNHVACEHERSIRGRAGTLLLRK